MKVSKIVQAKREEGKPVLSFEIFPPKKEEALKNIDATLEKLCDLHPDFISITFGAGGSGTNNRTVDLAKKIKEDYDIEPLVHLTCISHSKEEIKAILQQMKEAGLQNVLALRGDVNPNVPVKEDFKYASELVAFIKEQGDFHISGACYPEGHVESSNKTEDITHLKEKVEAGCDFVTTQMFFDNNILYNYLYRIRERGITVPVIAGIMPVTNVSQIKRICQMSGTYLPSRFKAIVDRFGHNPAAMRQAGIAYATEQIIDLIANGVNGIHIYSMNKPEVARRIQDSLSEIL